MGTAPVVVGIDASESARAALRWAAEYANRFDLPLEAVIAWDLDPYYGYPILQFERDAEERAQQAMADTIRDELGEDAALTQRVLRGKAAPILLEAGKSASLLVVGTRGHGAFTGMLLGSVSQHCAQHATCPVVIIPSTNDSARE